MSTRIACRMAALVCSLFVLMQAGALRADETASISVVDEAGRTQSLVETAAGAKGTIKVFVQSPDGNPLPGVTVALLRLPELELFGTSQSLESGVASFFDVPVGAYQVRFECGNVEFETFEISLAGADAAGTEGRGSGDSINIIDASGSSRAFAEFPVGDQAQLAVTVKAEGKGSPDNVKVRLIELDGDEELEVVSEERADSKGQAVFTGLRGGEFKVELTGCGENFRLGGVGMFGYSVTGLICPPGAVVRQVAERQGLTQNESPLEAEAPGESGDAAKEIRIVDEAGRTQSLVETDERGFGTVRVFVQDSDGRGISGMRLALVSQTGGKTATALTRERGVATFFKVPPGTYRVSFDCGAIELDAVEVTGTAAIGESAADTINIIDGAGSTRAVGEVPIGGQAGVRVKLVSTAEAEQNLSKVRIELIRLDSAASGAAGKESAEKGLEVVAEQFTESDGTANFEAVTPGDYRIQIRDCNSRATLSGVGLFDISASGVICGPPAAIASGLGGGGGAAGTQALTAAFSVAPAGAAAGGAVTGTVIVGASTAGVATGGANESTNSDDSTPTANPDPEATPDPGMPPGPNGPGTNGDGTPGPTPEPTAGPTSSPDPDDDDNDSTDGPDQPDPPDPPDPPTPPLPPPPQPGPPVIDDPSLLIETPISPS